MVDCLKRLIQDDNHSFLKVYYKSDLCNLICDKFCDRLKFNLEISMYTKINPEIQKVKGKY